jgi:FPC/CPF motif-containing protein YcgG
MREFELLRAATLCPFAAKAKIWGGPRWDPQVSRSQCLERCARDLSEFTKLAIDEGYDGYVAEVGLPPEGPMDLEAVRRTFHWFLRMLALHDESCRDCMTKDFLDKRWQFEFGSVRMFLNVFSSYYPKLHSKYAPIEGAFFVFFQPEQSFKKFDLDDAMTRHIRDRFAAAGMPYNGRQIDERIEALLYMFPEDPDGPPVMWWL